MTRIARVALLASVLLPLSVAPACGKKKSRAQKAASATAPATPTPTATPATASAPSPAPSGASTPRKSSILDSVNVAARHVGDTLDGSAAAAAVDAISEEDERALGQATAIRVVEQGGGLLLQDVELLRYVNRVANAVGQQGARKALRRDGTPRTHRRDFTVGILDDDASVNAFATPGGYLFLTTGLFRNLGSESELAWVLGHEIAHVDLEHPLKALKLYVSQKANGDLLRRLLSGPQAADRGAWNNSEFFSAMAVRMASISTRLHGKEEERAADLLGLQYAVAAGYDANGAERVLEMMAEPMKLLPSFASHDSSGVRATFLLDAIGEAKASKGYLGRIGASRFTHEGIDRLDAAQAAARAAAPSAAPSAGNVGTDGKRP